MKRILCTIAALAMAGCAGIPTKTDTYLRDKPPEYASGYRAGCNSGYAATGNPYYHMSKDVVRATSDALYRTGWDDGYMSCKAQSEAVDRAILRR